MHREPEWGQVILSVETRNHQTLTCFLPKDVEMYVDFKLKNYAMEDKNHWLNNGIILTEFIILIKHFL